MFLVGAPSIMAERLTRVCFDAMWRGIRAIKPGSRLGDIGHAIQSYVEEQRFSVVREYCGHGIGRVFHEDPQVLHYGRPGTGVELVPGMTITVEPMVNAGKRDVKLLSDGWTVVTKDHSLSAQWEHTVLVTDDGLRGADLEPGRSRRLTACGTRAPPPAPLIDRGALEQALPRRRQSRQGVPRGARKAASDCSANASAATRPSRRLVAGRAQVVDEVILAQLDPLRRQGARLGRPRRGRRLRPRRAASAVRHRPLDPPREARRTTTDDAIGRFLTFLWDIGLEVGHSVRTLDECEAQARSDVTVLTTLMETRLLHGPGALFAELPVRIGPTRMWNSAEFFHAKLEEQKARHARYHDTAYNLEPNVKGSPGGLRDIQMIGWLAQRHLGTRTLADLVRAQVPRPKGSCESSRRAARSSGASASGCTC